MAVSDIQNGHAPNKAPRCVRHSGVGHASCFPVLVQVNNTALTSVSERSEEIIDHKKRKTVAVRKEKRKEKEMHRGDKPGSAV